MGRAVGRYAVPVLVVLCSSMFPAASAALENVLDEKIAVYILAGIAALYFSITVLLLLLAAYCCCCKNKRPRQEKNEPHHHDSQSQGGPVNRPLATIPEGSTTPSQPLQPHTQQKQPSHKSLKRLRSDEQELITNGASIQPSTPTDLDAVDMPSRPATAPEDSHSKLPVQKTPDPRRKKAAAEKKELTSPMDTGTCHTLPSTDFPRETDSTPKLPGTVSPVQKTPDMSRTEQMSVHPAQEKPDAKQTTLAPLQKTPITRRKQQAGMNQSKYTAGASAADYVVDGKSEHLSPIRRTPNSRLDSPRMRHRQKDVLPAIGMTTFPKAAPNTSKAEDELTRLFSELDQELESSLTAKKTRLDTSFLVKNPVFEGSEKVGLLELQRQLKPVSQHWYEIGLQLKVSKSTLNVITKVHGKNSEKGLMEVCHEWLRIESEATWDKVVAALKAGDLVHHTAEVAEEISKRFCHDPNDSSSGEKSINSDKSLTML